MGSELVSPLLLGDFTERGDADGIFRGGGVGGAMVAPSIPEAGPVSVASASEAGASRLAAPGVASTAVPQAAQNRALEEVCFPHEVQNMGGGILPSPPVRLVAQALLPGQFL